MLLLFDALSANKRFPKVASKVSKFEPGDKAWLQDSDPTRHGCKVIVLSKHQKPEGTWEYALKYESSGNPVTVDQRSRFPETLLTRKAPSD
jgi:hypothetical protein